MSLELALVTHPGIGRALLTQTEALLGPFPCTVRLVDVALNCDAAQVTDVLGAQLCADDELLILVDVYGATPSNIARDAELPCANARVHGLNLPMLMRAHNYADRPLPELVDLLVEGGRRGIFADTPDD